ncbi:MAG: prefoldin subunit alpha [Nanoarchaeota archaeon]
MATEEQIQEKYMHLQLIAQTLRQVQQQLQMLDEQSSELDRMADGLGDLKDSKIGSNLLVPVSEGIFARATLSNSETLLVNVGSNVIVEKTIDETRQLLQDRNAELRLHREELKKQNKELFDAAQVLQDELNNLITQ